MAHIVTIYAPQPIPGNDGVFHIEETGTLWLDSSNLHSAVIGPSKEYKTDTGTTMYLFSIEIAGKVVFHDGNIEQREVFIKTYFGYN